MSSINQPHKTLSLNIAIWSLGNSVPQILEPELQRPRPAMMSESTGASRLHLQKGLTPESRGSLTVLGRACVTYDNRGWEETKKPAWPHQMKSNMRILLIFSGSSKRPSFPSRTRVVLIWGTFATTPPILQRMAPRQETLNINMVSGSWGLPTGNLLRGLLEGWLLLVELVEAFMVFVDVLGSWMRWDEPSCELCDAL